MGCLGIDAQTAAAAGSSLILEEDIELAATLDGEQRESATRRLQAQVISIGLGAWDPPQIAARREYGLLILDGVLARRGRVADAVAIEILGPGDLLRPCDRPLFTGAAAAVAAWEVLQPARLAVLDARVSREIARWPQLAIALSGRLSRRVSNLNHLLAVSHLPKVEDRLLATLRFLASHCGRVRPDGLVIPLKLTHERLGELVGAQRPSVSLALKSLCVRRLVCRCADGGYVVYGDLAAVLRPPAAPALTH